MRADAQGVLTFSEVFYNTPLDAGEGDELFVENASVPNPRVRARTTGQADFVSLQPNGQNTELTLNNLQGTVDCSSTKPCTVDAYAISGVYSNSNATLHHATQAETVANTNNTTLTIANWACVVGTATNRSSYDIVIRLSQDNKKFYFKKILRPCTSLTPPSE